jgi:HK97 gp10 family phage protein
MATKVDVKDYTPKVKMMLAQAIQNGLEESAMRVHARATELSPVDTGRLSQSITYRVDETSATVGSNVVYARRIEYGHSKKAPKGYLRPALDEIRGKLKGIFDKHMKKVLK